MLSGLEVSGQCQGLSGLSVCEDVCTLSGAVGAVGLSGCYRVVGFRVLSGGVVGLLGLCRGEQPYFVVSGLHQGLTQHPGAATLVREKGVWFAGPGVRIATVRLRQLWCRRHHSRWRLS